jgi:signal peptidase II
VNGNENNNKNLQFTIYNLQSIFKFSIFKIIFFVVVDQLSKFVAVNFGLDIVKNRGIAFSILSDIHPVLIGLILLVLLKYIRENIWPVLIFAGGVSNLIDRIRFGYVVDFIDIKFWPVFNLADVFITIGVLGILYGYIRRQ